MEKSDSIQKLAKALCEFQGRIGKIKKDSSNPFFKSKYASLSTILSTIQEPLTESGLSFVQFPAGQHGLTTLLMHESGEYLSESYVMTPVKNDPQGLGSSITYQRRYALGAVLGLNIDDDDDANAASTQPAKKAENSKKKSEEIDAAVAKAAPIMTSGPGTEGEEPPTIAQKTQLLLLLNNSGISPEKKKSTVDALNDGFYNTITIEAAIEKIQAIVDKYQATQPSASKQIAA
jgi:hypothetical protein